MSGRCVVAGLQGSAALFLLTMAGYNVICVYGCTRNMIDARRRS